MKKYRALLFDLDGTLLDIDGCEAHTSRKAIRETGAATTVDASWPETWEIYSSASMRHWNDAARMGLGKEEIVERIMRDTLAELGSDQRF